ncbi:uncharacterized protein OCT59_017032 [Rhizophagus irregularis]|nr:hypothetical protein OCT59_017032 [Rhizophagus irregularis]
MKKLVEKNKTWLRKRGDSNTSNLWRHLERHPSFHLKLSPLYLTFLTYDDDQPFTTLENKYFRQMIKLVNSDLLVSSADTLKNDILESSKVEQKKIKELFQSVPEALDSWISMNNLFDPHSGENLCNAFVKSCHEFRILAKVFAVKSDNASNNITFMKYLDQLKAGDAQTEDDIMNNIDATINAGEIIPKLRKLVVIIKLSPQHLERFARHSEAANLKDLKLILDVKTRLEGNRCNEIISVLKIFVQTTKILSSVKYSNAFFCYIYQYIII